MNKAFIVTDLGFGDSGKGTITDSLVRQYNSNLVIRHSGASQCAHFVHTNNTSHCFSQFGSGTLAGARTYLGPKMLINPLTLDDEAKHLQEKGIGNPYENLFIDENCIIITPFHKAMNKLVELSRGNNRYSSCAQGVWETVRDNLNQGEDFTIRVKDIKSGIFLDKLNLIQAYKQYELNKIRRNIDQSFEFDINFGILFDKNLNNHDLNYRYQFFCSKINIIKDNGISLINSSNCPIFEGNQGVLLDDEYGFHPYSTPTKTTPLHAVNLLNNTKFKNNFESIGVLRTFLTRHGNGPLHTEFKNDDITLCLDDDNKHNEWQGHFREGWQDLVMLKYAINAIKQDGCKIDSLAITHCDKLKTFENLDWKVRVTSKFFNDEEINLKSIHPHLVAGFISQELNIPIKILSHGKTHEDKSYL